MYRLLILLPFLIFSTEVFAVATELPGGECNGASVITGEANGEKYAKTCHGASSIIDVGGDKHYYHAQMVTGGAAIEMAKNPEALKTFFNPEPIIDLTEAEKLAQFVRKQRGSIQLLFFEKDGDKYPLGGVFKLGEGLYLTALHVVNIIADYGDVKVKVYDHERGRVEVVNGFSLPSGALIPNAIDYNDDLAVLSTESYNGEIPELNFAEPSEGGSYVEIDFTSQHGSLTRPSIFGGEYSSPDHALDSKSQGFQSEISGSEGIYSQTETDRDHIIILNRRAQNEGASGGVVFDFKEQAPVGLALCMTEKGHMVHALRLQTVQDKIVRMIENGFAPYFRGKYNFIYSKRDQCQPIGNRGMTGDENRGKTRGGDKKGGRGRR